MSGGGGRNRHGSPSQTMPEMRQRLFAAVERVDELDVNEQSVNSNAKQVGASSIVGMEAYSPTPEMMLKRNRVLGDRVDTFRRVSAENEYSLARALQIMAIGIVSDIVLLGLGDRIAYNGEYDTAKRLAATQRVVEVLDALIALLEQQPQCVQNADGAVELNRTKSVLETLRLIKSTRTVHERHVAARDETLRALYKEMMENFTSFFHPEHCGSVERPTAAESECSICCTSYSAERYSGYILRPRCCGEKQAMCVECWVRRAFTDSAYGQRPVFSCAFCRAEHPIFDVTNPTMRKRRRIVESVEEHE